MAQQSGAAPQAWSSSSATSSSDRGLPRGRDADPGQPDARGRARLPGAEPPASGQLLRAAAEPAAVQAAVHGGGRRPLLSDRALLPRRGPARQSAARVHPARPRDVVRRAGGRARGVRGAVHRADRVAVDQAGAETSRGRAITWQEAMDRYGSDKPDLRYDLPIVDVSDIVGRQRLPGVLGRRRAGRRGPRLRAPGAAASPAARSTS